jgi:phage shock protein E
MQNIAELLQTPGATIVDVRSPMEYATEKIEGAINIPVDQVQARVDEFRSMSKPIIVYCRSGARSGMASAILKQSGISEVYNGGSVYDLMTL